MKAASLHEIKKELETYHPDKLRQICLRLGRFKLENKELISYLLFESSDEEQFIRTITDEMGDMFLDINRKNYYYTKKGLRKILRHIDKRIRYSGSKETELRLRSEFCQFMKSHDIPISRSKVLRNIYERQAEKMHKAHAKLHEDLQYDYQELLDNL